VAILWRCAMSSAFDIFMRGTASRPQPTPAPALGDTERRDFAASPDTMYSEDPDLSGRCTALRAAPPALLSTTLPCW
jgi:hypothetical protein